MLLPNCLSCYLSVKSVRVTPQQEMQAIGGAAPSNPLPHYHSQLSACMMFDKGKLSNSPVDCSSVIQAFSSAGLHMQGMQQNEDKNDANILCVYLWSGWIHITENGSMQGDSESALNYNLLFKYINYVFVSRFVHHPSKCLRYFQLKIRDPNFPDEKKYELDSRFLESCVHARKQTVGLILNLYPKSTPFRWPENCEEHETDDSNPSDDDSEPADDDASGESPAPSKEAGKKKRLKHLHVVVCDANKCPHNCEDVSQMRVSKEWNSAFIPVDKDQEADPEWLKAKFGLLFKMRAEQHETGVAHETIPFTLHGDPHTKEYVQDATLIIYEEELKRSTARIFSDWKKCMEAIQQKNKLFLTKSQWKKHRNSDIYLPIMSSSLVQIISRAGSEMQQQYSDVLGIGREALRDEEKLEQHLEKLLREKMKL